MKIIQKMYQFLTKVTLFRLFCIFLNQFCIKKVLLYKLHIVLKEGFKMTWQEYQNTLIPLIQHFGKSFYTIERVRLGFQAWKDETQETLLYRVNEAISSNMPFDLNLKQFVNLNKSVNESKLPYRKYYKHEEVKNISDGFLDTVLENNNATSLVDLVRNYKNVKI